MFGPVPAVFNNSVPKPRAVFESALLRSSAKAPTAVLKLPVVRLNCANAPKAEFAAPAVTLARADLPVRRVKHAAYNSWIRVQGLVSLELDRWIWSRLRVSAKAQCRQSPSECELSFEVSRLFCFLWFAPGGLTLSSSSERRGRKLREKAFCLDPGFQMSPSL